VKKLRIVLFVAAAATALCVIAGCAGAGKEPGRNVAWDRPPDPPKTDQPKK
jgi:hypothetical protein